MGGREGAARGGDTAGECVQGDARGMAPRRWPRRSMRRPRRRSGSSACPSTPAWPPTRTRASRRTRASYSRCRSWRRSSATAWAFLEPEILAMDPAMVERFVAQEPRLAAVPPVSARRPPPQAAHAHGGGGTADRADRAHGRRRERHRERLPQCRPAVSDGEARRRPRGAARRVRLLRRPRLRQPGRSPQGDGGVLRHACRSSTARSVRR